MKAIELIKKYKVYILTGLMLIFFFKSCSKNGTISKLEKENTAHLSSVDSLKTIIEKQQKTINGFPEIIRKERLSIYLSLDDTISRVDRSPQLMGLHQMIKDSVRNLTNK